jgi:hypothetical protein
MESGSTYPDEDKRTCGVDTTKTKDDKDVLDHVIGRGDTDDEAHCSERCETTDERRFVLVIIGSPGGSEDKHKCASI